MIGLNSIKENELVSEVCRKLVKHGVTSNIGVG